MSTPSIYKDGTITVTQDSAAFTGASTAWTTQLKAASLVFVKVSRGGSPEEFEYKLAGAVAEISADGEGTFDEPCPLDTVAGAEYFAITWNSGAEIAAAIRTLMTEQVSKGLNKNVSGVPLAADYREGDFVRDRETGVRYTKDQGVMVPLTAEFANAVGQWAGSEARFALSIVAGQVAIDLADGEVGEDGAYYYSLTVDEAAELQLPLGAIVGDVFDVLFTQSGGGNAVTFVEGYSVVGSVRTLDTERSRLRFTVAEVAGSPDEASSVTGVYKTYLQNDMVTDRGGTYISTQDANDAEPQIDAEDAAEDSAYWLSVLQVGPEGAAGAETVRASSVTSLAVGTGTKVFTLAEATARGYVLGTRLRAASDANPGVNWMEGPVTAYAHPSITIEVELVSGAGTLADWSIGLSGEQGPSGGGLADLVDDLTPQLGGPLDANAKQVRLAKGADVVSANALALGNDGNYFDITGTTAITSIGTKAVGTVVRLHFDAALALTHHATDLILPGGVNITTAAGDEAEFIEYAVGDWRCTVYIPATGVPQKATDADVRSAAANKVITGDRIESASAYVALTDAATVAVDWDTGINFSLTVTANRAIGNPTNGQPGTYRSILVQGDDATDRTITFGNQFLGDKPTIVDCDSTKWYDLTIKCITATHFTVTAQVANKP